jgi:hypothetical protein
MAKNLPARIYFKHGAFYYVTLPERKWIRLGKTEFEMYAALSKIKVLDAGKGTILEYFVRYENEIIPNKSARTQVDNLSEIKKSQKSFWAYES